MKSISSKHSRMVTIALLFSHRTVALLVYEARSGRKRSTEKLECTASKVRQCPGRRTFWLSEGGSAQVANRYGQVFAGECPEY